MCINYCQVVFILHECLTPEVLVIGQIGPTPEEVSVGCECGQSIQVAGQAPQISTARLDTFKNIIEQVQAKHP
jgi:hypothetical protein